MRGSQPLPWLTSSNIPLCPFLLCYLAILSVDRWARILFPFFLHSSCLGLWIVIDLGFWFHVSFYEMVMTMILWNNVSLALSYLYDVRSNVGEGPIRLWYVKFDLLFHVFAIGVLIRGGTWLAFDTVILTSCFGMFYHKVLHIHHNV